MKHDAILRDRICEAVAADLRGCVFEVYGDDKNEQPIRAMFLSLTVNDGSVEGVLKSEPAKTDVRPKRFRARRADSSDAMTGLAGPGKETDTPEVIKAGGVVTFKFKYKAPT